MGLVLCYVEREEHANIFMFKMSKKKILTTFKEKDDAL